MSVRLTTEICVRRSYFEGLNREETHNRCGLSTGTVSSIWISLKDEIGRAGIATRDLAIQLKKLNLTPGEAMRGSNIYNLVEKLGIKEEAFETFAKDFYDASVRKDESPEILVDAASRLIEIEEESGLQYEEILKGAAEKSAELKKTEESLDVTRKAVRQSKLEHESMLKENKTTKEVLESYVTTRDRLRSYKLDVDQELEKVANVLTNVSEQGYDVDSIVREAEAHGSLVKENHNLKKENDSFRSENKTLEKRVEERKAALSELASAKEQGFTQERLGALKQKIVEIGASNGMAPEDALTKFFKDLEQYDAKVGNELNLKRLESQIETKSLELEGLTATYDTLDRKFKDTKAAVNSLQYLTKKGVDPMHIIEWEKVLEISGVQIQDLLAELEAYGGIKTTLAQKKEELTKEKAQVEELKTEHTILVHSIETIRDEAITNLQRVGAQAHNRIDEQKRDIENLREKTLKYVGEIVEKLRDVTDQSVARTEEVASKAETSITQVGQLSLTYMERFREALEKHVEAIGKLQIIAPFFDLLEGKKVEPQRLHTTVLFILGRYKVWMAESGDLDKSQLHSVLDGAIKAIQSQVTKEPD